MRRIFGCLRINTIISRIPVRIISMRERQGHIYQRAVPAVGLYSSCFSGFMSVQNRWQHAHHTRQIDGDSGWGGGVRLASARAAAAAAACKATEPGASDTTGRAWPVY